jgi:diguanylate cyclase (GGDEF)-like protein
MRDYDHEIQHQISDLFLKIVFPFMVPVYLATNLLDRVWFGACAAQFLWVRLAVLPVVILGVAAFKAKWPGRWDCYISWALAFSVSAQITYMACAVGRFHDVLYAYLLNLLAGASLFLPLRFGHNLKTLALIYLPPSAVLAGQYLLRGSAAVRPAYLFYLYGMLVFFVFIALWLDRLRHRAYLQKVNLFFLATTDALSGLKLRRYFFHRFVQELSIGLRRSGKLCLSVLLFDLDSFKAINDRYGHEVGDRCIRHVGAVIRSNLRVYDTACRLGGEEFVVLLPETGLESARVVGERIRRAVEAAPVKTASAKIAMTVSIGLSGMETEVPPDYGKMQRSEGGKYLVIRSMLDLMKKADEAMYRAKQSGKNCLVQSEWVPLASAVDGSEMKGMKSYLVYFDQDVFSVYPDESVKAAEPLEEEINFYAEEFFFRRCVESLSRHMRNPHWSETLALIWVRHVDQIRVKQEMSRLFRATDTLCMLEQGLYGTILFGVDEINLRKTYERVRSTLANTLEISDRNFRMAACRLEAEQFPFYSRVKGRLPVYSDLVRRVNEILRVLRGHRFSTHEDLCYFMPAARKKSA